MRSAAPPVRYASPKGDAAWRWLQRGVAGCAGAATAFWLASWLGWPVLAGLLASAAVATVAAAGMGAALGPAGVDLNWDGATWTCDGVAGEAAIHVDLGDHLLVRFLPAAPGAAARWLGLSRRGAPAAWHALRCALVNSPRHRLASAAAAS